MSAAPIITPEVVQGNLQRFVSESEISLSSLAALASIPIRALRTKLASDSCPFTVTQVAGIMRALELPIEAVFIAPVEPRELQRRTEPGSPEFEQEI